MKITGGFKWLIDFTNQFEDVPNWITKLKIPDDKLTTLFLLVQALLIVVFVIYSIT